jgi:outer membrane protein OmpA-like peptidoglycan-associated protein
MSGPSQDPKPKKSSGDLKISLTPAGLFVVAMIVFFFAGGIFAYVQLVTRSLQNRPPPPPDGQKSPPSGYFFPAATVSPTLTPSASPLPTATPKASEVSATPSPSPTAEAPSPTPTPTPEPATPSPSPSPTATPAPSPTPVVLESPPPSPTGSASSESSADSAAEPLPTVTKNAGEEERVRKEVLARIDLLKELTAKEKDYLYAQVERARGFTKLAIIPFVRGRTKPEQYQIDHMLSFLEKPDFKKLFEDPTVVLVIAAYADKQGSDEQNLQISRERATNLMKVLQTQGHVTNTIRAVGMGGLDFFDKNDAEKNRIAEIWLVAP